MSALAKSAASGGGCCCGIGMNGKRMFEPKTTKINPRRTRALMVAIFMTKQWCIEGSEFPILKFPSGEINLRESAPTAAHHSIMRISEMNWMMVEEYLKRDDRCVLPLGSTEQHAYLSLSVDSILAERLATEVGELAKVPVLPVQPYGITPYFRAFSGTITLRVQTFLSIVREILDGLHNQGFKRILIVNGHGGNTPAQNMVGEWLPRP